MKRYNLQCVQCTVFIISVFLVTTVFISILIEEKIYYHEKDFDYGPYNENPTPTAKTKIPIVSRVKLPHHDQEDSELVKDLASKILPPCSHTKPYGMHKTYKAGIGKFKHIRKMINDKGERFFLECGAGDGETKSNTLYLERSFYWQGLLVEADPAHFQKLVSLHRKAWIAPACMSLNTSAYVAHFKSSPSYGGKIVASNESFGEDIVEIICYPFYTFVLALEIKRIDYLSLNVAGHELEILETIPFHKVDIAFISVNFTNARGGKEGIKQYMLRHGYDLVDDFPPHEIIFVNIDEDYW